MRAVFKPFEKSILLRLWLLLMLLASCSKPAPPPPEPPRPALWEVSDKDGVRGWLFGTVHALPDGMDWQNPAVSKAVKASDALVLELGKDEDAAAIAAVFTRLARSFGHPVLSQRVPAERKAELLGWMKRAGIADPQSHDLETWAASLMIAHAIDGDKEDGVEAGLLDLADGKPVVELEGADKQLRVFDRLAEQDQRDLLLAILAEADDAPAKAEKLARQWRSGDMEALAAETQRGLLADKELREALLVGRNKAWAGRIEELLRAGKQPFIAVGAAHMAGDDGLPAMLAGRGWTVRRIQ